MQNIDDEIEIEYDRFLRMAVEKNIWFRVNQMIGCLIGYFTALFNTDFQSMGLKLAIPLLIIFRYIMGIFVPIALYSILDWIIGNVIWIMVGVLIIQSKQNESTDKEPDIEDGMQLRRRRRRRRRR